MIGHHQEIERSTELDPLPRGRAHFLTPGETIGILQTQGRAEYGGIDGQRRVEMRVAPEDLRRVGLFGVGRVGIARAPGLLCDGIVVHPLVRDQCSRLRQGRYDQ